MSERSAERALVCAAWGTSECCKSRVGEARLAEPGRARVEFDGASCSRCCCSRSSRRRSPGIRNGVIGAGECFHRLFQEGWALTLADAHAEVPQSAEAVAGGEGRDPRSQRRACCRSSWSEQPVFSVTDGVLRASLLAAVDLVLEWNAESPGGVVLTSAQERSRAEHRSGPRAPRRASRPAPAGSALDPVVVPERRWRKRRKLGLFVPRVVREVRGRPRRRPRAAGIAMQP